MSQTPPDWYPDPHDPSLLRYWDGQEWTEHTSPAHAQAAPEQQQPAHQSQDNSKRNLFIVAGIGIAIGAVAVFLLLGGGDDGGATGESAPTASETDDGDDSSSTPGESPAEESPPEESPAEEDPVGAGGSYPLTARDEYLSECERTSGGQTAYCECTLEKIQQEIPYDEFVEIDADIAAGGAIPDQLKGIIDECIQEELDL